MDAAIKTKWIEALRSGKYQQGKNFLRDENDKYCCLGVLCDIIDPSKWEKESSIYSYIQAHKTSVLPDEICDMLKITNCGTIISSSEYGYTSLANLNDDGKTFEEIADLIEKHF